MVIYLGYVLPHTSSSTPDYSGTALHRGKDLAVSPSPFDKIIPEGTQEHFCLNVTARTS